MLFVLSLGSLVDLSGPQNHVKMHSRLLLRASWKHCKNACNLLLTELRPPKKKKKKKKKLTSGTLEMLLRGPLLAFQQHGEYIEKNSPGVCDPPHLPPAHLGARKSKSGQHGFFSCSISVLFWFPFFVFLCFFLNIPLLGCHKGSIFSRPRTRWNAAAEAKIHWTLQSSRPFGVFFAVLLVLYFCVFLLKCLYYAAIQASPRTLSIGSCFWLFTRRDTKHLSHSTKHLAHARLFAQQPFIPRPFLCILVLHPLSLFEGGLLDLYTLTASHWFNCKDSYVLKALKPSFNT